MTTMSLPKHSRSRVIGAIAAKDITDAIKNRTILSVFIGVVVLLLTAQAMPLLSGLNDTPGVVVYAIARDELRQMRRYEGLNVRPADSPEAVQTAIGEAGDDRLGLVLSEPLPADDRPLTLTAYHVHWLSSEKVKAVQKATEAALGEVFDRPVSLEMVAVYPTTDAGGQPAMTAVTFVMIILVVGATMVPFLFVEEREGKTMDMLLVSPATVSELVAGKALAGLVYVFVAAAVLLALQAYIIVHWPLAILAILLSGLMAVMIGLVLGVFFDNLGNLGLIGGPVLLLLLIPPVIEQFIAERAPAFLVTIIHWLPNTAMSRLLRTAMAGEFSTLDVLLDVILITGFVVVLFLLVVWRVRRMDR